MLYGGCDYGLVASVGNLHYERLEKAVSPRFLLYSPGICGAYLHTGERKHYGADFLPGRHDGRGSLSGDVKKA
jgi:hypothetical protein